MAAPTFVDVVAHGSNLENGTSWATNYPSQRTLGHLLFAYFAFGTLSTPGAITWPAGWTVIASRGGMSGGGAMSYAHYLLFKQALGTETNFNVSWTNANRVGVQMATYNPQGAVSAIVTPSGGGTWDCINPVPWNWDVQAPAGKPAVLIYAGTDSTSEGLNPLPAVATQRAQTTIDVGAKTMWLADQLVDPSTGAYNTTKANGAGRCFINLMGGASLTVGGTPRNQGVLVG